MANEVEEFGLVGVESFEFSQCSSVEFVLLECLQWAFNISCFHPLSYIYVMLLVKNVRKKKETKIIRRKKEKKNDSPSISHSSNGFCCLLGLDTGMVCSGLGGATPFPRSPIANKMLIKKKI